VDWPQLRPQNVKSSTCKHSVRACEARNRKMITQDNELTLKTAVQQIEYSKRRPNPHKGYLTYFLYIKSWSIQVELLVTPIAYTSQGWAKCGPRAACGPRIPFVWPADSSKRDSMCGPLKSPDTLEYFKFPPDCISGQCKVQIEQETKHLLVGLRTILEICDLVRYSISLCTVDYY